MLRPYWITLRRRIEPSPLNLGVGITADSEIDARNLFMERIGGEERILEIKLIENMGVLDENHVVPNMGNPLLRGIWFPLGYDSPLK